MMIDEFDLRSSTFLQALGLEFTEASGTRVIGTADLGPDQHQPQGIVHGGVYCAIIETVASVGATLAIADRNQRVVGVHNATDFLRATSKTRASVVAEPIHQGRTQQLWQVIIAEEDSGKQLARGQVRLQNLEAQ